MLVQMITWKRIIHSIVTLVLIAFLIWYYLPDNKLIRKDVCLYYEKKSNQKCSCTPINNKIKPELQNPFLQTVNQTFGNEPG